MYIRCFTIFLMICCSLPATVFAQFTGTAPYCHERGGLILNEISNMGASGQDEYFELIVMPDPNNPTANINISGWIIDDNNYPGSGVGTATGYLAFGDCYTSVPPGSILVVYDSTNPNAALPADDPTDSNSDNVYIIPDNSTCMFKCSSNPNTSSSEYCPCTGGLNPGGSWVLGMRNQGDLAQVRNPDEVFIHGIHWGDVGLGDLVVADPNLIYFSGNSGGKVFMFNDGDYGDDANWTESNLTTDQTPGAYNNATNQGFITNILADPAAYCQGDIAYPCKADAGDLTPPTGETNGFTICQGQDKPAFGHNYAAPDEDDPGAGYSYIYVLSKNTAPYLILGLSTTGDFDLSTLPFGTYYIWGLSVKNSDLTANGYANITDYADGFANVNTLLADEVECGFCSDLDNKDDAGNIMSFNVISPILASSAPNSICLGESATIILTLEDGATVTWSPGGETDTSITITPTTTTTYTATVVSLTCPTVTMNFTVAVENCSGEYCPDFDISGSTATNTTYCMPAGGNVNLCFAGTDLPPGGEIKWFYSDTLLADPTQGNLITTLDIPESVTTSGDVFWDFGTGAGTSGSGGPAGTSSDITKATGNTAVRNNPGTYWGVTPNGTCGDGVSEQYLNANTWNNTTLAQAIAAGRYYEVCVTADAACDLRITNISLSYGSSTTGPTSMSVLTSDDGFTNPIGSSIGFATLTCHSISFPVPNHLVQSGQQYCVRVYAYNTSNITGTFRIDDVDLDWNSVCPPNYDGDFGCTTFTLPTDDTMCGKSYYFTAAVSPFSDNCLGGSPEPDPYTDPIQINISCPQVQGVITNILCNGQGNGSIDLTVTGGVGPYNFTWAGPEPIGNIEDPTNLIAGTYNVTVTETASGAGCTTTGTYTITQPAALTASLVSTAVDTCGLGNGAIIVTATGGTEEYSFSIDNIAYQPSPEFYNLNAGTYTIWVDDANGCGPIQVSGINITATPVPDLSLSGAAPEICNGNAFDLTTLNIADANSTSGTISWHSGTPANAGNQLASTTVSPTSTTTYYALKTTTPYGCTDELAVTLTVHPNPTANITPDPAEICQGGTINFNGNPSGGSGIYNTHVWTGSGTVFLSATNIVNPVFTATTSGSFTLTYTVTDSEGCTASDNITVTVNAAPTANITPDPAEICQGGTINFNGNPSGGSGIYTTHVWTGSGTVFLSATNIVNPVFTATASGSFTLTYTVTDSEGCTASDNITVTVNAAPTANITPDPAEICQGGTINFNGNPSGGSGIYTTHVWTGSGTVFLSATNIVNPVFTATTSGSFTLTYTVTDSEGCTASDNITVTVNATMNPNLITPPVLCEDDAVLDLNLYDDNALPGVWSGTGVTGTTFNPAGLGGQTITLTYDPADPCANNGNINVTINALQVPILLAPAALCANSPVLDLSLYDDDNFVGTWSGVGVFGNSFDPSIAGTGNHVISFTPSGSCVAAATINIVVNPTTTPVLGTPPILCDDDALLDLNLYDDDLFTGVWSGTGVSGTNFDPSGLGGQTITLIFDPDGDCSLSASIDIEVKNSWTPNVGQPGPYCEGDPIIDLNTFELPGYDGTWTGLGVVGADQFDPSLAGVGNHALTFTGNTPPPDVCPKTVTINVVVNPSSQPVLGTPAPVCATDAPIDLTVFEDAAFTGAWSGIGVSGTNFDPSGLGGQTITLTFDPDGDCGLSENISISVMTPAIPNLTQPNPLCVSDNPLDLNNYDDNSLPGTWSGIGVTGTNFDPSVSGAGTFTITYTPSGACTQVATLDIVVNPDNIPVLTTPPPICATDPAFSLIPYQDINYTGTWSGLGVMGGNTFSPSAVIPGNYVLTFSAIGACVADATIMVTVIPAATPVLTSFGPLCDNDAVVDLTLYDDDAFTGTWSGLGVAANIFDPSVAGAGNITLTFTPSGGCGAPASIDVVINAAPVLSLTTPAALCAGALAFDLTPFASPTGGSWAGPGVAGTAFDPANGNIGANWLVYSLSQNGCTTTDSIKVVVNPNSDPILTTPPALCASSGLIDLSPYEDPNFAGQWLGSGVVLGSQFDPAGFAGQTVTITFDPDGNCGNTADVNITVYPYVSINLVYGIQTISALNCNAPFDLNIWLSDANGNPLANPVWSGGGFVDALGLFTPSGLSPGNYTATCLVTDPISGCSASMDLYIQINEVLPLLVTGTTICANDPAFDLYSLVLPGSANGEWSGLGVSNGIFDPASVSGQTSVTLTYSAICNDASLIDISMGCPADYVPVCGCDGVDYSNACIAYYYGGVTAYIPGPCGLYPSNTIGNCGQNPENITIIIEPLLSAATQAPAITKLCNNGNNPNQIDLDDLVVGDMGGMWSVSPDGTIDAGNIFNATGLSTGIYTFTYVVTGSCNTDQTTQTIEIIDCDINCTESAAINPPTPICALAGNTLDLNTLITGTPGGTWAILPAVPINAGSIIDVSALNGNYAITYTVTGAPGCPDVSETETLTVQLPPVADINPPTDPLCQGDVLDLDDLLAAGTGTNGVWNTTAPAGTIGAGNIFNSSGLAEGSYTITYGLSGLGVCPDDLSSQTIMVVVPTANAGIDLDVCGLSTTLNALGDAGTWTVVATPSGTATANFSFPNALITNVTVTEPGVYTFNYAGTKNNCTANDQVNINFVAPLNVQYTTICAADETTYDLEITVSGGVPPYNLVGATFIGTNPYVANFASNTPFNIAIDDANAVCPEIIISGNKDCSCQPTATDPIVVNPNLTWCENEAIPSFTIANLGDTYYWLANINDDISLAIATGNSFTPPGIGTYWVVAQSSGGCLSNVVEITANELPVGTMTVKSPYVVCEGDVIGVLVLPTTFDGSISWTSADGLDNGSSKAGFLPVRSLPGIYQYFLTETYTDGTCTSAPTPVELIINAKGKPNLPPLPNLCDDASVVDLTDFNDPNYEAGTWTGNGVGNNLFDPKTAGLGIFDLIFTPAGACSEADTAQIEVIDCSACFTVTQKAQGATTICSGQPADLPFFEASVIISDPSNFTGLTWFEDPALTKPVSAAFWQFTAPDNCILQQKTLYLGAACALLSQPILAGDITVVINPPFDSNLLTLNTPADCEIPTISTNCSIYKITPISVPIVINPGDNGNATWSVTLNTTAGCWTEFVDIPYNCPNICPQANLVQTAPALSCDGDIINLEIAITPANALLNTDYSVQWYENGNPIAGATNLTYSTTAQAQTCNEITNAYSVVIKCLKTTDPDITLDAGQVIIPPKFDQANLTITNGLCGTLPNITSGCSTYTITPINVPTIINPGETGQAEYQISGNCFLETVFVDYACPDVLCPTVTTTLSGSIKFCDGNAPADFSNFEGQIIINDPDAQANGFEWFKDVNLTQTVNPDDFVYNGNGCSLPIDTAYIALLCKDGSKIKAGWLSVVVYVAPVNIVQPNPCVLVVASACPPGSVVVEYLQSNGTWAAAPEAGTITANWRAYLPFAPDNDNDGQPDCITTGTSTIPENNLTVNAGPNQTICQGQLAALVATISGGQNPNSGTWTTNDGGSFDDANAALTNFNPDAGAGVYTLVFTVSDECYTASDEVVITVLGNTLTVNAGPDQTICQGEPINLSATITTSGGNATGQWTASVAGLFDDANNVNAIFTPTNLDATEVWCYFTANDVCGLATDSVLITILPNVFVDAGLDKIIFLGQTAQLEATGATAYLWETDPSLSCLNCANPIASPTQTTTYIVATPDACGNSDTVTVVVNEKPIAEIQIPSAFSPNNDNINDVFKPFIGNAPFTNYIFAVYDRWGNQLFETTDPADGWNGTYKFKDLEVGVYVFYATIWFEDEPQARKLQGNVTLVR